MKNITKIMMALCIIGFSLHANAQETCGTNTYFTTNAGWSESEYYQIINIDAESLTGTSIPAHDKNDGTATSATFGSGTFNTPIMTTEDGVIYTPTSVNWPVNYYMSCITNTFYNSAYTKVNVIGSNPSGGPTNGECTWNNNSVKTSPIWDKKGFIELSRLAQDATNAPGVSRHGYIEINDLPQVERIQWTYSSVSWKRGVKLDIKHGDGAWEPLRWVPSDVGSWHATFSEQGYAFEEIIGKGDNPESKISLRFRIWDGDTITVNPATELPFTIPINPLAQYQVARIHQIKVFSGVIPTTAPSAV
jgi:hypothetical protein